MARKRKATSRRAGDGNRARDPKKDSKLRINTYEDVADSEDEFFINRDKVLLDEGPEQRKRRKIEEEGTEHSLRFESKLTVTNESPEAILEPSDEEVLPAPSDVSVSDDDNSQDDGQFSPKLIPPQHTTQKIDYASDASNAPANVEDDDAYDWGTSRKDYYNADLITTEADALEEEAEARRLQKKQLQGMTEADFGLDDIEWVQAKNEWTADGDDGGMSKVVSEVLPKVEITDAMSPEEKMKILRVRYPEFEPLAKEYVGLQTTYQDLSLASKAAAGVEFMTSTDTKGGSTIAAIKLNALGGYLAALCMYFALLSATDTSLEDSTQPMEPSELHDHKIMDTLIRCRQLWERVKDMEIPEPESSPVVTTNGHAASTKGEAADPSDQKTVESPPKPRKRTSNSAKRAARALAAAQAESEARRLERLRKTEESLKDLSSLTSYTSYLKYKAPATTTNSNNAIVNDNDSDLGDPATLTPHEAAEKAARKRSLRFYTSQIAQKSNRRDAAGKDAGGDADIPYKERIRDRQARLNAEAEARGKKKDVGKGAELDNDKNEGGDSGSETNDNHQGQLAQDIRADEDEDYYALVSSHAANKKALKTAEAEAARTNGTVVRMLSPDPAGGDGKRGVTYAIEKNKGLAPKRRKEVRNPRVKRRKKFEDKKKRLGSVRQVFKGGEGRGGYKGELTGIKGGLVRSVKL
ncbi:MAG: hypothetical protein LQ338_004206 [Usnochroma carphineum]|nr:MAG: hypothetical protein LQ338_004206 [Usnochroma carphineum]